MLPAPTFPLAGQSSFGQNSCDASFSDFVLFIHHRILIDALFKTQQNFRPPDKGVLPLGPTSQANSKYPLLSKNTPYEFCTRFTRSPFIFLSLELAQLR
jgi:hypothetical protein